MGLPDIPPPPTSFSLKRCRSEDPPSLADLFSPPPSKLPFPNSSPHHLSILQDLESSLATEAAVAPDELVTEMMQSLEKVMGDIEALIFTPGHPISCDDEPRCGGTPTADLPQGQDSVCILDNFAACSGSGLASPETYPDLCRDVAAEGNCDVGRLATTANSPNSFDDCQGMAPDCTDAVSALVESCTCGVAPDARKDALSLHVCEETCARDNVEVDGLIDISGGDLAEQSDGQWSLLDEFCGDFADSALPSNQIDWLEEGCDLAARISLTQFEEEDLLRHATDNTELLLHGH
ncbi:hypothetical protein L7F22_027625 [Adiantum nelumboides]|nr:hypothetical protein [Adiantum nelumboides]